MPARMRRHSPKGNMGTAIQQVEQHDLDPREDLSQHAGQWVALRDGLVVASALDPVTLRDDPDVQATDVLMAVPSAGSGIFVA
jgi:hypothetical protein